MTGAEKSRDPLALLLEGYIAGMLYREKDTGGLPFELTDMSVEYVDGVPVGLRLQFASGKILTLVVVVTEAAPPL